MQFDGILFDLDNTLHDRDEAFEAWARAFLTREADLADGVQFREAVHTIIALDRGGEGDKLAMFEALRQRYQSITPSAQELLADFFATRTDFMALCDNVEALLASLNKRGMPWGIVTNGRVEQWDKLHRLELHMASHCIFVSDDFGVAKPDPSIFLAAVAKLGIVAERCLFVGDHPVNDIMGARSAGLQTAWLSRGRTWPEEFADTPPNILLEAVGELLAIVYRA